MVLAAPLKFVPPPTLSLVTAVIVAVVPAPAAPRPVPQVGSTCPNVLGRYPSALMDRFGDPVRGPMVQIAAPSGYVHPMSIIEDALAVVPVGDLLRTDLRIPNYQRPYSWEPRNA